MLNSMFNTEPTPIIAAQPSDPTKRGKHYPYCPDYERFLQEIKESERLEVCFKIHTHSGHNSNIGH